MVPTVPYRSAVAHATAGIFVIGHSVLLMSVVANAQVLAAPGATDLAGPMSDRMPPQTAWGAPDLEGVWDYRTMTPLQRPQELAGRETLTPEEAAEYEERQNAIRDDYDRGSPSVHARWWLDFGRSLTAGNRTALIVDPPDGRIPATTDAAKQRGATRAERRRQQPSAGVENRGLTERCISFGLPRFPSAYNNNYLILQTPAYVAIVSEMIHDVRIIPVDGRPHLSGGLDQLHGDSRGRYEGNTLVVETRNFSSKGGFRGSTDSLRLVERFTRVGPDMAHYAVTLADPETWIRPWTALVPLNRTDEALYEYACHEGNYGLRNILRNARLEEKMQ